MSSRWEIRLPVRSRGESPIDALCDLGAIEDPEDRLVAREIIGNAAESGVETMGEVIDRIETRGPTQRRELLDRARVRAGLETTSDVRDRGRFEQAMAAARRRRRPRPTCAVCGREPTDPGGFPAEAPVAKRWHCQECQHLAEPGDMDPPPVPLDWRTMSPIPSPEEAERAQREDERIQAEHERKMRVRREEAEAVAAARERYIHEHRNDPFVNPWAGAGWSS